MLQTSPKPPPNIPKMFPKCPQNVHKTFPKHPKIIPKTSPKRPQNVLSIAKPPKRSQNFPKRHKTSQTVDGGSNGLALWFLQILKALLNDYDWGWSDVSLTPLFFLKGLDPSYLRARRVRTPQNMADIIGEPFLMRMKKKLINFFNQKQMYSNRKKKSTKFYSFSLWQTISSSNLFWRNHS